VHLATGDRGAGAVDELDLGADRDLLDALDRDRDVDLESAVVVDGRDLGERRDPVADPDRDVADDALGRRGEPVVAELDLVLPDLGAQGVDLGLGGVDRRARLVEGGAVDGAAIDQVLRSSSRRASARVATREARVASAAVTLASWRAGSIWMSG
jgi:hypothetical protein